MADDPVVFELNRCIGQDKMAVTDAELWSALNSTCYYHRNLPNEFDELSRRCGGWDNALEINCPSRRYVTMEDQEVVHDADLDRICLLGATMRGGWIDFGEHTPVFVCYSRRAKGNLSVQLQARFRDYLKCVLVVFRQDGTNIVARADWAAKTGSGHDIGYDFESEYSWSHDDHKIPIATSAEAEGFGIARLRYCILPELQPNEMPVSVYKSGTSGGWEPSGWMGNTGALKVDANAVVPGNGLPCMRIDYAASDNWAGVCWQDPQGDWGEKPGGKNLSKANTLFFRARGEKGGERVSFGVGGHMGKMVHDTCDCALEDVILSPVWTTYRIDLHDLDLSRVKTGFRFWLNGQGAPVTFYLDSVFYDHVDDSQLAGISRNALPSLLARAEIDDPVAEYELGLRAESGRDSTPDIHAAKRWYLKAACHGEMRAADALRRLMEC